MAAVHLGVTGGIGSGKSTVAAMLAQMGASVIDADALSRACTGPGGAAMPHIAAHFGRQFVADDGSLNRDAMRALVFGDPLAREQLEGIIHPLVQQEIRQQARRAGDAGAPCIVYDIPLLVESPHWRQRLQRVLIVDCSTAKQIARVQQRSGLDAQAIARIMDSQAPRHVRLASADIVIVNDGINLSTLRTRVHEIGQQFGL